MKKNDFIFIGALLLLGVLFFLGFRLYANSQSTGNAYAKVTYKDTIILMIDLHSNEYTLYDTIYKDQIDVSLASEGIFYVPGSITSDMTELYRTDEYARTHEIVGIKLAVENEKIYVAYQESPHDTCQLQSPTNSSLTPLVCLPNELVVSILTNMTSDEFIPDAILE